MKSKTVLRYCGKSIPNESLPSNISVFSLNVTFLRQTTGTFKLHTKDTTTYFIREYQSKKFVTYSNRCSFLWRNIITSIAVNM